MIQDGLMGVEIRKNFGKVFNEDGKKASIEQELDFYENFKKEQEDKPPLFLVNYIHTIMKDKN